MSETVLPIAGSERISQLLWSVNLCAICASTLSYVYLSHYTYKVTGSVFLSQIVLFSPVVLPVLLVGYIHRFAARIAPRSLLISANLLSLAACAIVYSLLSTIPLMVLAGGALVGTLDAMQRVARIVATKRYFSTSDVRSTAPLTRTPQFIAGGVTGGALGLVRAEMTPLVALAMTCVPFAAAALAAALLPRAQQAPTIAPGKHALWFSFSALLRSKKHLRRSFWVLLIFVSVYQVFFNVSRVTLPAHALRLSEGYVGFLQSVNSVAALIGAVVYYTLSRRDMRFPLVLMAIASAVFMITAASGVGVVSSYVAYFLYIFFFELAFFKLQEDVVASSPPPEMSLVASVQYAGVYAGMILTLFIGSILVEQFGLIWTSVLFVAAYVVSEQ